ncbi:MAG: T9SS type A sorting domain-containing protein [Bacteroidales bacterium]|nr:T9SS type A sorting domain-containing protein [Bacteroidales bacterium]
MKKLFTISLIMLGFLTANAQYLLQENFEGDEMPSGWTFVDSDGDGYNWAFSKTFDGVIWGHNGSEGSILSQSYDRDYTLPLTPDNWLISPEINLTSAAELTFWVCAQDMNYPAEHYAVYIANTPEISDLLNNVLLEETLDANGGAKTEGAWKQKHINLSAYAGQTVYIAWRHFNCSDEFYIKMDDIEIFAAPTEPTITVNDLSFSFPNVALGSFETKQTTVLGYSLTEDINVTATENFLVSSDGVEFASTTTLSTYGGTLYIRYAPEYAGENNGEVVLSSAGAEDFTISVSGSAVDCSAFPIFEGFESGQIPCWTIIANGDPQNNPYIAAWYGEIFLMFVSFYSSNDYNQYLISPEITYHDGEMDFSLDYKCNTQSDESFRMGFSTTTNDISAFTWVSDITTNNPDTWTTNSVLIPAEAKYVAVHYSSYDKIGLYVDNISVTQATSIESQGETSVSVYPNPTSGILNIEAEGYENIEITNICGQLVRSISCNGNAQVDVTDLSNGTYIVRMSGVDGTCVRKFVKE